MGFALLVVNPNLVYAKLTNILEIPLNVIFL
jgi:hypothetical protein